MQDFRAEIWDWIVQSCSDFSASTLEIEAFQGLTKEQRCDLAARYMADLGVDGNSMVSAQGTSFPICGELRNNNGSRSKSAKFREARNAEASNQRSGGRYL